jgi:hypothetical protein
MTQTRPLAAMSSPRSAARFLLTAVLLSFGFVAATTTAFAQTTAAAPVTQGETPITITVGDTVMTGRLNSTVMARHLADRLPMTVDFGNHGIGTDDFPTKVHKIEPPLPTEGTELGGQPGTGEIAHYVPNGSLGFYYGQLASYWPGVVSLGTFDGDPEVFARQSGPFSVTIEVAEE